MSTYRPRRISRSSAEQTFARLIEARSPAEADDPISALLTPLVPTPLRHETDGERRALSAFQTAPACETVSTSMRKPKLTIGHTPIDRSRSLALGQRFGQLLTIKVAVAATILAAGGIAVAASSGQLARGLTGGAVAVSARPTPPSVRHPSTGRGEAPTLSPRPIPEASTAAFTESCRVFTALNSEGQKHALRGPAFARLVQAAHGRSRVTAFCASLLAGASSEPAPPSSPAPPKKSAHPTHPSHPPHPSHPAHP